MNRGGHFLFPVMALFAAAAGCVGTTATLRDSRETLEPRALGGIAGKLIDVEEDRRNAVCSLPLCVYVCSFFVCSSLFCMFVGLHAYLRTWILANQQNHKKTLNET
jgi:hypothetical protein